DRILSTRYGKAAVDMIMENEFGKMVTLKGNTMSSASLEDVIGNLKNVDTEGELVGTAKSIGISFGE
ncbi:MAG: 6-phosphofructokinase, partial [Halothermotrichaceae bacterium]